MDMAVLLARGDAALDEGRWRDAQTAFAVAAEREPTPRALLGLADAKWWLGDAPGCLEAMESAYARLRREGDVASAVVSAVWIAVIQHKTLGNRAACAGWIARAARLLENQEAETLGHGWVWLARAYEAVEPAAAEAAARKALRIARAFGDADLELCALAECGAAQVAGGRAAEGLAAVDEAMSAALGGEGANRDTVVSTTCAMLVACDLAGDLDRVRQWCRAADRFMRTYGSPFLYADCRSRYGSVLLAGGHWPEAEDALEDALRTAPAGTEYHARALVRLAELRVRQGRHAEAERLLDRAPDHRPARAVRARARLARGEAGLAAGLLARSVAPGAPADHHTAESLALLVEVHVASGNLLAAGEVIERLVALEAGGLGERAAAWSAFARGAIEAAGGAPGGAAEHFATAAERFDGYGLPYETARARLRLAEALADDDTGSALVEALAARTAFERLGASPDADAAARLVRSLGGPARTGPKDAGVLTRREQEVLRLLGEGLSNPEIAERLFISRKTASHHVSNVLAKLGLRNRAEAAAHAARRESAPA